MPVFIVYVIVFLFPYRKKQCLGLLKEALENTTNCRNYEKQHLLHLNSVGVGVKAQAASLSSAELLRVKVSVFFFCCFIS